MAPAMGLLAVATGDGPQHRASLLSASSCRMFWSFSNTPLTRQ